VFVGALGYFTFVLHSHLPYVRLAGRWPHGEEWIHEAACETYIPLLQTLYDLRDDQVDFRLTIGITPILAEQLSDPIVLEHLDQYIDTRIYAAKRDMSYFSGDAHPSDLHSAAEAMFRVPADEPIESDDPLVPLSVQLQPGVDLTPDGHLHYLAKWYKNWYKNIKTLFNERFKRDIIGAFRQLQDEGYIEIITSAATHSYMPLMSRDSTLHAQIQASIASYKRMFDRDPTGFWLPECAYRPAYVTQSGKTRPGIETLLREYGIKVFFGETHTIIGGNPVGIAAGDVIGPYGDISRRYVIPPAPTVIPPRREATTFEAYYVSESIKSAQTPESSGVAVIGRNNRTGQQVWSADWGYPGDFDYREFHKKAGTSGLQYWRVTGARTDLAHKDFYHPEWASYKLEQHAEHFAHLVGDLLRDHYNESGEQGLIASNYDTELFGHWWFEGVTWLGKVLRHLSQNPDVELTTASEYVREHPPETTLHLPESSWGAGGTHFTWYNGETSWMWTPIHEAEARMEKLASTFDSPTEDELITLNQAARECLLLQSSDWPFLITTGQAREYAIQRFSQHIERFNRLADSLEQGRANMTLAEELFEIDKVFPDIDYRWFAEA
jgi:1,4-alpha-glucan branching enzyme